MRIAIDLSQIIYGTGVSRYQENLVENLLKIDKENEYLLFGGSLRRYLELRDRINHLGGGKTFPLPPTVADILWNKLHFFPIELLIGKIDVFHSSDWSQPTSSAFKVTTVHDLYPIKFPKLVHPKVRSAHQHKLEWVAKEVDRIIVPSLSTKNDLVIAGIKEDRIRVIGEAPVLKQSSKKEVEEAKKEFGIQGDYLIAIGATPLKNTEKIIEAFHLARSGYDLKLIIVGRPVNLKVEEERNVRFLGHVLPQYLAPLMTGAEALVFPSIYEGYGLPILDGFSCGVPVVTSNVSSMPEVAGNAAVLVDPYSTESIVEGIKKALSTRQTLIKKGLAQVKKFSWEKTARETLKVYREAASSAHKESK